MGGNPPPIPVDEENCLNATIISQMSDFVQLDGNVELDNSIPVDSDSSIPVIITNRTAAYSVPKRKSSNITIKRSNKLLAAVQLPVVVNLNPRIYDKREEFKTMIISERKFPH